MRSSSERFSCASACSNIDLFEDWILELAMFGGHDDHKEFREVMFCVLWFPLDLWCRKCIWLCNVLMRRAEPFDKTCLDSTTITYFRHLISLKNGPFFVPGIRPRNRNAKCEPRLSGLTVCVPDSGPECGLIFGAGCNKHAHPKCGPGVCRDCGAKLRVRERMGTRM